jgi:hypothetical protein
MKRVGCVPRQLAGCLVAAMTAAVVAAACAADEVMPAPSCSDGGSSLIAAQSVPGATQIPCFDPLPDGWVVASVSVDQDRTTVRFDSDRAGDNAAILEFARACDVSGAVKAPSDLYPASRFDDIERLVPGFRARRHYTFPGGCVSWSFDFDDGVTATESVAIGDALVLISRESLNDSVRDFFIDEEL